MKNLRITAVLAASIILMVLAGCNLDLGGDPPPDPVTIVQRIDSFEAGLNNADRSDLYLNFHQDTADRQSVADPTFWETSPLSYASEPYTITIPATLPAEAADGTVTVNATYTNDNVTDDPIIFVMKEQEADVWYILSLTVDTFIVQTVY